MMLRVGEDPELEAEEGRGDAAQPKIEADDLWEFVEEHTRHGDVKISAAEVMYEVLCNFCEAEGLPSPGKMQYTCREVISGL